MYNREKKKEIGITLVALAVTIIVLLILAGISISIVMGENGLIGKAKSANEQMIIAKEKEAIIWRRYKQYRKLHVL